jgi:hypothetical protein
MFKKIGLKDVQISNMFESKKYLNLKSSIVKKFKILNFHVFGFVAGGGGGGAIGLGFGRRP